MAVFPRVAGIMEIKVVFKLFRKEESLGLRSKLLSTIISYTKSI